MVFDLTNSGFVKVPLFHYAKRDSESVGINNSLITAVV